MSSKEKLLEIASKEKTQTVKKAKARIERRKYSRLSKRIALIILARLDKLGWKQVQLAEKMGVSAQQVNKWVKGNENFTIEMLINLSEMLDVDVIQVKLLRENVIGKHQL